MSDYSNPSYVSPLVMADYERLFDEDIKRKDYANILEQIDVRFDYVFCKAMEILERRIGWYAYGNVADGEDEAGEFDPDIYSDRIEFAGDIRGKTYGLYENDIPTSWLFEDFEAQLKIEFVTRKAQLVDEEKEAKQKKDARKLRRKDVISSIKSKLTAEELSFISFLKE